MAILPMGTGTVPVWRGYGHIFIPMDSIHTLPAKSWVGHGYNPIPMGIPIPYPFVLTYGPYSVDFLDMIMRL